MDQTYSRCRRSSPEPPRSSSEERGSGQSAAAGRNRSGRLIPSFLEAMSASSLIAVLDVLSAAAVWDGTCNSPFDTIRVGRGDLEGVVSAARIGLAAIAEPRVPLLRENFGRLSDLDFTLREAAGTSSLTWTPFWPVRRDVELTDHPLPSARYSSRAR